MQGTKDCKVKKKIISSLAALCLLPNLGLAQTTTLPDFTTTPLGFIAVAIFVVAYALVMLEEVTHLKKSKVVILSAGILWALVAWRFNASDLTGISDLVRHNLVEYTELFLFLLVAMVYINAMEDRAVFAALRTWLINKGYSLRQIFWITSSLAFLISPVADNLTTALLMCAVVMAIGGENKKFINLNCICIVVAANAGGAFSPFGDITTLMVWQKDKLPFSAFFSLFMPALVNFLIPALCMHFAIPKQQPVGHDKPVTLKIGAKRTILLFLLTIVTAVLFRNYLQLPPAIGMMTGLAYLKYFARYLRHSNEFDIQRRIQTVEWDTLFFFYGILFCVSALASLGYLELISTSLYQHWSLGFKYSIRRHTRKYQHGSYLRYR